MTNQFSDIVACCLRLSDACIPSSSSYDDCGSTRQDGHHYGTRIAMENALGRPLADLEMTCLSLGRCYGPTPALTSDERKELMDQLWPHGNHHGSWCEWDELSLAIQNGQTAYSPLEAKVLRERV